jgi:hypothetical protein
VVLWHNAVVVAGAAETTVAVVAAVAVVQRPLGARRRSRVPVGRAGQSALLDAAVEAVLPRGIVVLVVHGRGVFLGGESRGFGLGGR